MRNGPFALLHLSITLPTLKICCCVQLFPASCEVFEFVVFDMLLLELLEFILGVQNSASRLEITTRIESLVWLHHPRLSMNAVASIQEAALVSPNVRVLIGCLIQRPCSWHSLLDFS